MGISTASNRVMRLLRVECLACALLVALPAAGATEQIDYLKASNVDLVEFGDNFGYSVAISGDTMVVGAAGEASGTGDPIDNSADRAGAAYVYAWDGSGWQFEAYLKPHNPGNGDQFGYSVAISGDTIVVGALQEDTNAAGPFHGPGFPDSNNLFASGAAYVFVRDNGAWTQQAMLKATNADSGDFFGANVAIVGDTIAVGARGESSDSTGVNGSQENSGASGSGAAYVFTRSAGIWSLQAYLKASNTESGDNFGRGLAMSGDTIAVGAFSEDGGTTGVNGDDSDNSALRAGAVYVFVRDGSDWAQQAYIKPSNTDAGDQFGGQLSLSGDTLAVGVYEEQSGLTGINPPGDNNGFTDAGAAYVFVRSGTTWSEEAYIKASNTGNFDNFGASVGISGDVLVVGAPREDSGATGIDGDQFNGGALDSGAAYVFERSAGTWTQSHYVKASNTQPGDWLGYAAAIDNLTIAFGAIFEDREGPEDDSGFTATDSGAVFVFRGPDNVPPEVSPPAAVQVEATAELTPVALGSAAVTDNSGELLLASPDNPGPFPLGETTVVWSAVDSSGNIGTATQLVTVVDTTPPQITAPENIAPEGEAPLIVPLGSATVNDNAGQSGVTVENDAPPGGFTELSTIVTWTATDASGNTATDTQIVVLLPPGSGC